MTYAFYNQFYLSNNLVLQPDTEAATTDQVVPLVKSGLGLGYVPQNFAKDALAAGDVFTIQLKEEIPTRHVGAGWRPCSQRSCARICPDAEQQRYAAECTISGQNCAPAPEN
jgi:DNA-binding transcriptional LysR family regulator